MNILRQNVGIDIAKDSFVAAFTTLETGQVVKYKGTRTFKNSDKGFKEFLIWSEKFKLDDLLVNYTMEATGVYYEGLAYFLFEKEKTCHVLLPNKAKKFAESLNLKSKTDKIDSKMLGRMGGERLLEKWELSSKIYRLLRTLSRERQQIVKDRSRIKNQLHAEKHSGDPVKTTIRRMKNHIKYLDKQVKLVEQELKTTVSKDTYISDKVKKVITIPGVAFGTAVTIIAETQGFNNISSTRQLSSYAGYDVSAKESGKWKGKTRISKKGNSHIRQAMYMPSLSSVMHSDTYKVFYNRLNEKKM